MLSLQTEIILLLPFQFGFFFVSFSCVSALMRTSSIMSNRSGKSGHLCLLSDLRGKVFNLLTIEYDVSCGFFVYDLYHIQEVLFIPHLFSLRAISLYVQFRFNADQFHNTRNYYESKHKYTNTTYNPKYM